MEGWPVQRNTVTIWTRKMWERTDGRMGTTETVGIPGFEDKEGCLRSAGYVNPDVWETVMSTPAVGDMTGDDLEIVVLTYDGGIYVLEGDGSIAEGSTAN